MHGVGVRRKEWLKSRQSKRVVATFAVGALIVGMASSATVLAAPSAAQAAPPLVDCSTDGNIFNTGYDVSTGGMLPNNALDANWEVAGPTAASGVAAPPPTDLTWGPANVGQIQPLWWDDSPYSNAQWISQQTIDSPVQGPTSGNWYYRYQFDLDAEVNPNDFSLAMNFMADNTVAEVFINGSPQSTKTSGLPQFPLAPDGGPGTDPYYSPGFYTDAAAADTTLNNDWVTGLNTIVVQIKSGPPNEGFAAQLRPSSVCPTNLTVAKTSDATADTRVGDVVNYTVTATNSGPGDYTEAIPAVLFDDLSGILDDASYNNDASIDAPGAPAYADPLLSWSGPLAAGETVNLTYSVTVTAGGDGTMRNTAWEPENPEDPVVPLCDQVEGGVDPTTGERCATVTSNLPRLTIQKVASETELPAVGDTVDYTVTISNPGPGDYTESAPAIMTDDLSNVLDAANYNGDVAATAGTVDIAGSELTWSGALAAGASVDVTYSVTYTGEGDQNLRNIACVPQDQTAPGASPCAFVQIPGSGLSQWKKVQASDTPAVAGSVLTYTLFFANSGEAAAEVTAIDSLTQVLDDATVTTEPSSDNLTVSRAGEVIKVTGSVPQGQIYEVTYQVTINPDGQRGDDIATNFLLAPGETPGECLPSDEQFPNCTSTPIASVEYTKAVSSSTDSVEAGTVLTYTITATNTGAVAGPVSREDVLVDVLDDADLTQNPASDTSSVVVSEVTDGRFGISGTLEPAETATITYEVTVKPKSERGNNTADNFLVPPGNVPPTECVEGSTECTSTPMPLVDATKSVNPESGTTVVAGQEVTYTLTFTNSGEAAGEVDYTDHLTGVLDDSALTHGPVASNEALMADLGTDDTLTVTGELAAGQTVTVTYTVTVLPDGQRADNVLGNVLAPSGIIEPNCEDEGVSCTENQIPLLDSWKTVEADTTPVAAGTVLTYTLHFENTGEAAATVDQIDDLTHVTDDADVTSEPTSDDLTVSRDTDRIAITGSVPAGETFTVSYQVTIREDGSRGDDIAANFLMPNDPDNPPAPPTDPVCQPDDTERPNCTVTPIGQLLTGKAVSADSDPIDAGTTLTYTLTFDNQGKAPVTVDHTDYLTDVLDDATLTQEPESSDAALTASAVNDERFSVTGEVPAGQTVTVSYQVTVNEEGARGNNTANNFLVPSDELPPTECLEGDSNCTSTPLPLIEPSKSADPANGTGVQAGQQVTYTLSFKNTGAAAGPVDYTDHLDAVLDDADLTSAPVSSDPALVATSGSDGMVRVTGSLEPGEVVTVTYTVTVKADGERGDNMLRNVVAKSDITDPDCDTAGVECTEHPAGELDSWKTVDPASGATLRPGAEATYTLHFENIGNASVDVSKDDVLTQVLDDANMTSDPISSRDSLAVSEIADGRFTVNGTLAAGEHVTVTYTVTVKPDGQRGDDRLGNFLVPSGELPPEGPCAPINPERPDCTVNHVSDVTVVKSSNPDSGTEVRPNSEVTYTLTFTNVSDNPDSAPANVDYTDHMVDVLDDATLTVGPQASSSDLTATTTDDTIRITGAVPAGEIVTVSYTVKVKSYDAQGNHQLGNVVAVTGEVPVCVLGSSLCTEHDLVPGPQLPVTGATLAWGSAGVALLLILGGAAVMVANRRRREVIDVE